MGIYGESWAALEAELGLVCADFADPKHTILLDIADHKQIIF